MKATGPDLERLGQIRLRPAGDSDLEFLYRVYAGTREEELALLPWTGGQREDFLRVQFRAQHDHYHQYYPGTSFDVIERDGTAIGRLYVDRREKEICVVDIALLPEARGAGIGGALMQTILDEARAAGKPVRIHVECNNPAMRLYDRLGFRKVEDRGLFWLMEWRAK